MSAVNSYPPKPDGTPGPEARGGEPSMEDILASIRRIIADDQSRQGPALRRSPATAPTSSEPPAPFPQSPAPAVEAAEAAPPDEPGARPVADLPVSSAPHANPPTDLPPSFDEATIDAIAHAGAAAILRPSFGPGSSQPAPASASDPAFAPAAAGAEPSLRVPEPVRSGSPRARPAPLPAPEDAQAEPLISPAAAAGIGSSFQALATTVFVQNTTMVEGMLRDMLRPMLKTWLDDNLPSIVERLVRSEIERVARGGRA